MKAKHINNTEYQVQCWPDLEIGYPF